MKRVIKTSIFGLVAAVFIGLGCKLAASQGTNINPTSYGVARKQLGAGVNIGGTNQVDAGKLSVLNGYMIGTTNGISTNLDLLCAGDVTNRVYVRGGIVVDVINAVTIPPVPTEYWNLDNTTGNYTGAVASIVLSRSTNGVTNATGRAINGASFYTNTAGLLDTGWTTNLAYATNQSLSLSAWVHYTGFNATNLPFLLSFRMRDDSDNDTGGFDNYRSGGSYSVQMFSFSAQDAYYVETYNPTTNAWVHLAFVYDGTTGLLKYYENAAYQGVTTNALYPDVAVKARFHAQHAEGAATGKLDEIGLWVGHALTTNQINFLYYYGSGRTYPY